MQNNFTMPEAAFDEAVLRPGMEPSRRRFLQAGLAATAVMAAGTLGGCQRQDQSASPANNLRRQHQTIFGCFGVPSWQNAVSISAHAARWIVPVGMLHTIILQARNAKADPRKLPWVVANLQGMHKAGVRPVVTFGWFEKWGAQVVVPQADSAQGQAWLKDVADFVNLMGESLYYVTLDNEPLTTYMQPAQWRPAGKGTLLDWYSRVAERIHQVRPELPICAPANNVLAEVGTATAASLRVYPWVRLAATHMRQMCAWANHDRNIASLDLHLYVRSSRHMAQQIAFARQFTDKPFLSTEWSQERILRGWINQPLSRAFTARWDPHGHWGHLTNDQYVIACMRHPVALEPWNDFVATAPLSPTFMQESYQVMCRGRVLLGAYSGYQQYYFPHSTQLASYAKYALTMLSANATVRPLQGQGQDPYKGQYQYNYQLVDWFEAISWKQGVLG